LNDALRFEVPARPPCIVHAARQRTPLHDRHRVFAPEILSFAHGGGSAAAEQRKVFG
jgi:hypothetical protein